MTHIPVIASFPSVEQFTEQFLKKWWDSASGLPSLGPRYTIRERIMRERYLFAFLERAVQNLVDLPETPTQRDALQNRFAADFGLFARQALDFSEAQVDILLSSGMMAVGSSFSRWARAFDPQITGSEIYQAMRNVWTMNGLQLLLGLPARLTPAIFAYSMLYPYTDNYLDDPGIAPEVKRRFNERFASRLSGEAVKPATEQEARVYALISLIEREHDRSRFPQVYEGLLAIHQAQVKSVHLLDKDASPYDLDVLGIAIEKGGTSVLADGYLVARELTPAQACFLYEWGALLHLVDDLQDVEKDRAAGLMTIFSQVAGRWPLDHLTSRTLHLAHQVMAGLDAFPAVGTQPLKELMAGSALRLLINAAGAARRYYPRRYIWALEDHTLFRFSALKKAQRRLQRERASMIRMIECYADNGEETPAFLGEYAAQAIGSIARPSA